MKVTTMAYAAVFCAAMIASYLTWNKAPEQVDETGGTVLIDVKPDQLDSIVFKSKDIDVVLAQKSDALGDYLWVSTTRRIDGSKPTPEQPATPGKPGEDKVEKLVFKAGKAGTQLVDELAPFRVARELDVKEADLDKFGFDKPEATLAVKSKSGSERTFDVGDTAYGHKHVYVREQSNGKVYVVQRTIVTPLERADSRLPEKELFAGPVSAVTGASISAPAGKLELVQRNRDDAAAASWTPAGSESANATAGAWLDKLFRLRATAYVPADQKPATEPVVSVKLALEDGPPVTIQLLRGSDKNGEEAWFAMSDFTRGMVQLSTGLAADAGADVATLFGDAE